MKLDPAIATALILAAILMTCVGCESRTVTYSTPDGRSLKYNRVSILGDSSSEGVTIARQGEDLSVDVGATGSQAKTELLQSIVDKLP